jgi:hypothetical protein
MGIMKGLNKTIGGVPISVDVRFALGLIILQLVELHHSLISHVSCKIIEN